MTGTVALTGTPGTGKSAVAAALVGRLRSIEVAELAQAHRAGRAVTGGVEVDLPRLRAELRGRPGFAGVDLVVGHLAHLLPLRDVIVLRCQPEKLRRRLAYARRGTVADRRENFIAEAVDVVLLEALRWHRRVWEVDTTDRSVVEVSGEVARRVRRRGPPSYGSVDWLSDPTVTAHLLDPSP